MSRLFPVFALLIAVGLFFGYISPTYNGTITENQAAIERFDSALDAAQRFQTKEGELSAARNAISPEALTRLDAFLPDGVDNVQLILDLDALADRSGMRLSDFDTSVPSEAAASTDSFALAQEDPIDSLNLTMTGTGTYSAFRTFLAGIEQSLRPLDIVAVDVVSSATGVYSYDITLRLYWLR